MRKIKSLLSLTLAGVMITGMISPILATVEETQNTSASETLATDVYYNQESNFEVIVPKKVDLGADKISNYTVSVSGDISSDETIVVIPDKTFFMKDKSGKTLIKDDVEATVVQDKTQWIFNEFETTANGTISAPTLTAGKWEGSFKFNISLESNTVKVVSITDASGNDLNGKGFNITGYQKEKLLSELAASELVEDMENIKAIIDVNTDEFENKATATFDVSKIAENGEQIAIYHYDEEIEAWEFIETATVDENGKITVNMSSFSPVAFAKQSNVYLETFSDNSWADIAKACQTNNVPDTWKVGDIKTMLIDGVEYEVAIIGKNHDTYADGSGTAPLTFQLVDTINTKYAMNSTNTNAGGWDGSALYTTLNTTILNTLEDDVKNNIKAVSKATNIGYVDAGNKTPTTTRTTSDKLFLLSVVEAFGTEKAASITNVYTLEGTQYEYYTDDASRIKDNNGTAAMWWLRTPGYAGNSYFIFVHTSGNYSGNSASAARGVAFGFCF